MNNMLEAISRNITRGFVIAVPRRSNLSCKYSTANYLQFSLRNPGAKHGNLPPKLIYSGKFLRNEKLEKDFCKFFKTSAVVFSNGEENFIKHWTIERVVELALLPVIPLALLTEGKALDWPLALLFVVHNQWGFESVISDYIKGETAAKVSLIITYIVSILTLSGLFALNYNDVGLSEAIRMIVQLKEKTDEELEEEAKERERKKQEEEGEGEEGEEGDEDAEKFKEKDSDADDKDKDKGKKKLKEEEEEDDENDTDKRGRAARREKQKEMQEKARMEEEEAQQKDPKAKK